MTTKLVKGIEYFLMGYGSLLELIPKDARDAENLYLDWLKVGEDLWWAIQEEGKELEGRQRGKATEGKE